MIWWENKRLNHIEWQCKRYVSIHCLLLSYACSDIDLLSVSISVLIYQWFEQSYISTVPAVPIYIYQHGYSRSGIKTWRHGCLRYSCFRVIKLYYLINILPSVMLLVSINEANVPNNVMIFRPAWYQDMRGIILRLCVPPSKNVCEVFWGRDIY